MPVWIKTEDQIAALRRAGSALSRALQLACLAVAPGRTTRAIDAVFERALRDEGAEPILKGLQRGAAPPFPGSCCVCVNEEVVHAVPRDRPLGTGDLVSIDGAARLHGWCVDAARSVSVGESERAARLIGAAGRCSKRALGAIKPGVRWSRVASEIRDAAAERGVELLPGFDGHGIGRALHEPPRFWLTEGPQEECPDFELRPGMVFTLEPIVTEQAGPVRVLDDRWTVVLADGSWACHEEITVAVSGSGADVLTRMPLVP